MIEDVVGPVIRVYCCRMWEVAALAGWGRCKLCGTRPQPHTETGEELALHGQAAS